MSEQSDTTDKPKSQKIHIDVAIPRSDYVSSASDPLEKELRIRELREVALGISGRSYGQALMEADQMLYKLHRKGPSVDDIIMKVLGIVTAIVMIPLFIWSMVRICQAW